MAFLSRTDLAVETIDRKTISNGIVQKIRGENFKITEITISGEEACSKTGKPEGIYITLESSSINGLSGDYNNMVHELSKEIKKLIPKGHIMVAGLGNDDITPDALGVYAGEKIIATRHMQSEDVEENEFFSSLRTVTAIIPSVMGKTGIESSEIIKSVVENAKPDGLIVIDALACADMSRLGTTIQISDTGISPGSGVQNKRKEISKKTLGIPVIAIGVPTVMDMYTIIENFTGKQADNKLPNMLVTPKDIDRLTRHCANLISHSINLALQDNLSFEDIEEMQR